MRRRGAQYRPAKGLCGGEGPSGLQRASGREMWRRPGLGQSLAERVQFAAGRRPSNTRRRSNSGGGGGGGRRRAQFNQSFGSFAPRALFSHASRATKRRAQFGRRRPPPKQSERTCDTKRKVRLRRCGRVRPAPPNSTHREGERERELLLCFRELVARRRKGDGKAHLQTCTRCSPPPRDQQQMRVRL